MMKFLQKLSGFPGFLKELNKSVVWRLFVALTLLGIIQHMLIMVYFNYPLIRIRNISYGLAYDIVSAAYMTLFIFIVPFLPLTAKKVLAQAVFFGSCFSLYVDLQHVYAFRTHVPFSNMEYFSQAGDFSSTILSVIKDYRFFLFNLIFPVLFYFYLRGAEEKKTVGQRLKAYGLYFLTLFITGGIFANYSNSAFTKNLHDPIVSSGFVYLLDTYGDAVAPIYTKPEAEMTTVTESLRPITRTDISADILNDISADYALMRYESYTSCKNAGAKKTDLGQYLCDTYKDLKHPNILFIYLESFRAIDLGAYGGDGKVSQGFDELAKEGILFRNFYANGHQTRDGQMAAYCSLPRNYGISMMRIYRENNYDCLPSVLKRAGYSTSFIFASNAGFDQQDTFFPKIGIDKIIDEVEFPLGSERLGWGYTDEVMFTKLLEVLDKEPQPFFSSALTSTNHHPFDVPDEYQKGAREYSEKYFETMLYTSDQLYKFIREAQKRDWYKNSIIFIFADHANNQPSKYHDAAYRRIGSENTASAAEQDHQGYLEVNYKIPLLVMGGLITQAMTEEAVSSEIDLPVTVADLLGAEGITHWMGQSLLAENPDRRAYMNQAGAFYAVMGSGLTVYVAERGDGFAAFEYGDENKNRRQYYRELGLAQLKTQQWLLQENKLWDPGASKPLSLLP